MIKFHGNKMNAIERITQIYEHYHDKSSLSLLTKIPAFYLHAFDIKTNKGEEKNSQNTNLFPRKKKS